MKRPSSRLLSTESSEHSSSSNEEGGDGPPAKKGKKKKTRRRPMEKGDLSALPDESMDSTLKILFNKNNSKTQNKATEGSRKSTSNTTSASTSCLSSSKYCSFELCWSQCSICTALELLHPYVFLRRSSGPIQTAKWSRSKIFFSSEVNV